MYFSRPAYAYAIATGLAAAVDAAPATCAQCDADGLFDTQTIIGNNEDLDWYNLTECQQGAYTQLGWNSTLWNGYVNSCSDFPASEDTCWVDLVGYETKAAVELCYDQPTWDGIGVSSVEGCTYPYEEDPCRYWDFSETNWDEVGWDEDVVPNACVLGALEALGWNKELWDCESTSDFCCAVPDSAESCYEGLNDNQKCWLSAMSVTEADWNDPDGLVIRHGQGQGLRGRKLAPGGKGPRDQEDNNKECGKEKDCADDSDCCAGWECRNKDYYYYDDLVCVPGVSKAFQCFSGDTKVDILGKGLLPITQLDIGDKVLTEEGYSEVYSFGRRNHEELVKFIKISVESGDFIELSPEHIIFVGETMDAYTADDVEVGHELMLMPSKKISKVVAVEEVVKRGSYHPYTMDGTIIANGVLASVYDAEPYHVNVQMFGMDVIDGHDFKHLMFGPLRLLCKISPKSFCGPENHFEDDGSHHLVEVVSIFEQFLVPGATEEEEYNFLKPCAFLPFNLVVLSSLLFLGSLEDLLALVKTVGIWSLLYFVTSRSIKKMKGGISDKKQGLKVA